MENKKLGSEPAFPFFKENESGYGDTIVLYDQHGAKAFYPFEKGMSKRFYAACAANVSWEEALNVAYKIYGNSNELTTNQVANVMAQLKYLIADELLKQENL